MPRTALEKNTRSYGVLRKKFPLKSVENTNTTLTLTSGQLREREASEERGDNTRHRQSSLVDVLLTSLLFSRQIGESDYKKRYSPPPV
ncbi:hypothetical protein Bpfe_021421 [Biomphalaria pfeifferi]|uniref:Uncharacterized protein n=1 Tax=Biomphalaria pfeifferi TaxID=112525 RepID=A0AAD8F2B8_BIOPF|nr:hypothetical protein Bpfe_021421 [Biomphalaria pfeifferi]